ncbi:DUF4388 domain-containing protein [Allocoleopsis franciscana]|uniref:PatA-like N-terminal domain-containing protein n=1 Tax=Allocoleopsis franciscana PCC 7113 TaxID=1173027 RepID=K9WLD0_9CYAN|nr:DUF4388 domain-containing protein [Allocoleopsis franciscana]AFZ21215.1 hypothetical protein Mic7113_5583 [Allocoleopsis franciscana PCC 7113]
MCIAGYLSDFSLAQICHLIETGKQTGLLTLRACLPTQASSAAVRYIWVYQGRLVAVAHQLDQQGLVSLIAQRQWINQAIFAQLVQTCPTHQPLGSYLKHKGALQAKQLKWLFQVQVLQSMRTLFQLQDAQFEFNSTVKLPTREMTGLSIPAMEATLIGLREAQRVLTAKLPLQDRASLTNSDVLAAQLPHPNQGLISTITHHPHHRLNALEWQVWEYTNGTVSLKAIARDLKLPIKQVQQIAFRLVAVGLVKEVPLWVNSPSPSSMDRLPTQLRQEAERRNVPHLFLDNFGEFLGNI